MRRFLIWAGFLGAVGVPLAVAAQSPLLAWRDPVYVVAGFAGVVAMALLLTQPLLANNALPFVTMARSRRLHRWIGGSLVLAVVVHVGGLWITSPPDVLDALSFASPTPFSVYGVIAMWALFATALLAGFRKRLRLRPATWRLGHSTLALIIAVGSVVHAMLIQGTMGTLSKSLICGLVLAATSKTLVDLKVWRLWRNR